MRPQLRQTQTKGEPVTKAEAIKIYVKSEFIVVHQNEVTTFFIGHRSTELDRLLGSRKSGVLLTAWNPRSKKLNRTKNRAANQKLYKDLKRKTNKIFFAQGREKHDQFFEDSFVAIGVSLEDAFKLGAKYKQNAVVYFEKKKKAELVWTASSTPEII